VDNFFAETEQVAFCTQNIVRGIDFTNDPLLQGRNFSYLDTQIKRLGGPNFTHIPINSPKSGVRHFQQDGHMAMHNPKGRANYEPNSWGAEGGPRENPEKGFVSFAEETGGTKQRVRSETFADHYSQARQFYISQTEVERKHIADALTFELSKVQEERIRQRTVGHLMNVHDELAKAVADGLGFSEMPPAAKAARAPVTDLKASDALSILKNAPDSFEGRKLGLFISNGADADLVGAIEKAFTDAGAKVAIVAPHVSGATLSDGKLKSGDEKINGGPSVVFDAVAMVFGPDMAETLAQDKHAQDFASDAFAHAKFIAYTDTTMPLFKAVGLAEKLDGGCHKIDAGNAGEFAKMCGKLRHWDRKAVMAG
ncbi:catalase, partial [Brevirhabdus sp.]|uniref:catalase n=1 Tax=Brevirhabdus sp. TaxID=2004514 RepID=UPI004059AF1F